MSSLSENYIPYKSIPEELGIDQGDTVLLTSDILRLAMKARKHEKTFDQNQFLDAFIEKLGPNGTLLLPAYNFDLESGDNFSIRDTLPMTGALAVAAMEREDFTRTRHPLHSFLVAGADAPVLAGLKNVSSFGPGSPFAYLLEKDALMVFAGTGVAEAMTFVHYVEESMQVKYRRFKTFQFNYFDERRNASRQLFKLYSKKPGYTMRLSILEDKLKQACLKTVDINGIPFSMIRCREAYEYICHDIKENNARSVAGFSLALYFRDKIKQQLQRFNLYRTPYGKIRSAKRIY